MPAQKGKDLLLKIDDGSGAVTIGGLRTSTFSLNSEAVDVTHIGSPGWRELLADGGVKRARLSGRGVFVTEAAADLLRNSFFASTQLAWQIIIPGSGTFAGVFQIISLEYGGDYQAEATFALTIESAGPLTFTAV